MIRLLLVSVLALFVAAPARAAELLTTASCGDNCQGAALTEEDGSQTRMLTSGPWDFDPQWFPEGRRVLPVGWASRTRALSAGTYVVRLRITDGSGRRSTRRAVVRKR